MSNPQPHTRFNPTLKAIIYLVIGGAIFLFGIYFHNIFPSREIKEVITKDSSNVKPNISIKQDNSNSSNVIVQQVDSGKAEIKIDQSKNKKEPHGDYIARDKVDNRTTAPVTKFGDTFNITKPPPRILIDSDKDFLDHLVKYGDSVFVHSPPSPDEAKRYADQIAYYLESKGAKVFDYTNMSLITPDDGKRFYYDVVNDHKYVIYVYEEWNPPHTR